MVCNCALQLNKRDIHVTGLPLRDVFLLRFKNKANVFVFSGGEFHCFAEKNELGPIDVK